MAVQPKVKGPMPLFAVALRALLTKKGLSPSQAVRRAQQLGMDGSVTSLSNWSHWLTGRRKEPDLPSIYSIAMLLEPHDRTAQTIVVQMLQVAAGHLELWNVTVMPEARELLAELTGTDLQVTEEERLMAALQQAMRNRDHWDMQVKQMRQRLDEIRRPSAARTAAMATSTV